VSVTAGPGTNSYGAFLSATGGGNGSDGTNPGPGTNGTPGTGSGGQLNFPGEWYMREPDRDRTTTHQDCYCWNLWFWCTRKNWTRCSRN
jgi:hypothetical protein